MSALRAEGYKLGSLLECAGLARSSYYYALSHPARPARPELRDAVAEIFSRTANGCGHRQVAMCLRAELGARIANKTVLKMMREMGVRCGIRRETVSVNLFFTSFAKQARRLRKGGFTGCANVFSPIPVTA